MNSRISVIGLGYIGLPTAIMLSSNGLEVTGTDVNALLVDKLKSRRLTFSEEGLTEYFEKALDNGIQFSTDYSAADIYIVAVPTPFEKETKKIDPKFVVAAVEQILLKAPNGAIVVIESTISPGFIDRHIRPLIGERDIHLVHAPERIIPGNMIYELINNSRTIGADSTEVAEIIKSVYQSFSKGEIVITDIRSAEMSKVVENTYRDINIAFANELAKLCRNNGLDVLEVIRIANKHPRVNILQPGPGVGGHCIPVDPWFLVGDYPEETPLIHQARLVNDSMPSFVLSRIDQIRTEKSLEWDQVGIYGLTYKENVDDMRESPSLQLLELIHEQGNLPIVYDPMIHTVSVENQTLDFTDFLRQAKMIVIMVSHSHIKDNLIALKDKVILDTRFIIKDGDVYQL